MTAPAMLGELYVIAFSNGIVKVGRSDDFCRRFHEHRRDAARFGLAIADWWRSDPLDRTEHRERRLIARMSEVGIRTAAGREYFSGVPFSVAVALAERLVCGRCPSFCQFGCAADGAFHVGGTAIKQPWVETPPGRRGMYVCTFRLVCGTEIRGVLDNDDLHPGGPLPVPLDQPLMLSVADYRARWRPDMPWTVWDADPSWATA
jgi:hypothetical protein